MKTNNHVEEEGMYNDYFPDDLITEILIIWNWIRSLFNGK